MSGAPEAEVRESRDYTTRMIGGDRIVSSACEGLQRRSSSAITASVATFGATASGDREPLSGLRAVPAL